LNSFGRGLKSSSGRANKMDSSRREVPNAVRAIGEIQPKKTIDHELVGHSSAPLQQIPRARGFLTM